MLTLSKHFSRRVFAIGLFALAAVSLPTHMLFAQIYNVSTALTRISSILNIVIPFIVGLAVFVIIWGIFNFIIHGAEEEKRAEAKTFIIFGILGVFIMLSIWGLINILFNSFQIDELPDDPIN